MGPHTKGKNAAYGPKVHLPQMAQNGSKWVGQGHRGRAKLKKWKRSSSSHLAQTEITKNLMMKLSQTKQNHQNHPKRPKTAKNGCFLSITRQDFTFRSRNLVLGGVLGGQNASRFSLWGGNLPSIDVQGENS